MGQNFRQRNLRGRSFKGQNLSKADFSHSDIRGADFADANLTDANFSHAKAGLQPHGVIGLLTVSLLLSALSGFTSATLGFRVAQYFLPRSAEILPSTSLIANIIVLLVYAVFWSIAVRQGLWNAVITVGGIGAVIAVVYAPVNAIASLPELGIMGIAANGITTGIVAVAGAGAVSIVIAGAIAATGLVAGNKAVAAAGLVATAATIVAAKVAVMTTPQLNEVPVAAQVGGIASTAIVVLCSYVGWYTLKGDEKNAWVRTIAVAIATTGGTNFRSANLTNANFSYATLISTDFRQANITRTCWYQAIKLDWARVGNTILTNSAVRNLLISRNGYQKSYEGANLRGANLMSADLSHANLKTADLSEATLQTACLDWANLTQVQAIGTDFTDAQLTGACLEAWNIDSTTQMEGVESKFIYLLEHPKPRTDDRERCPSSGEFAPGEFTKLFQKFLDTIDLIFNNNFNWKPFFKSFQKVQIENEGTELKIHGFEDKGDGVVVFKVSVPPDANKGKVHSQFMQFYQEALALSTHQQQLLEGYGQDIQYMKSVIDRIVPKSMTDKLVILSFGDGNLEQGFATVTAQIWADGYPLPTNFKGRLPPQTEIPELYQQWHQTYKNLRLCYQAQGWYSRIKPLPNEVRQVSVRDISKLKQDIQDLANELQKQVNTWLNCELFSPIQNKLRTKLNSCDRIQFIIQSDDIQMRRIPWHLWNFFEEYRQAEVAFSPTVGDRVAKSVYSRTQLRILAILGNSQGINVDKDRQLLENLLQAETVFLVEPTRREFDESLWDEKGWDILCFSGHSSSQWDGNSGWIHINKTDKVTIEQLENALKAAIERGLHLVILNSCDGLGLARYLDDLHIPQIIVMREPVPDLVAQEFLKNFLTSFSRGKSLYVSVREAREKLQSMEDNFPCASWLPIICQNHAEVPQLWQEL